MEDPVNLSGINQNTVICEAQYKPLKWNANANLDCSDATPLKGINY